MRQAGIETAGLAQGRAHNGFDVQDCRIEHGEIRPVGLLQQEVNLGAAQNEALGSGCAHAVSNLQISSLGSRRYTVSDQLIENNTVDFDLFSLRGHVDLNGKPVAEPCTEKAWGCLGGPSRTNCTKWLKGCEGCAAPSPIVQNARGSGS